MKILLVEPDYKNKYPPIGLMKISTYHKNKGDSITFIKGKYHGNNTWDRVYITTLFTFDYNTTLDTIEHYKEIVECHDNIHVGGILASIMYDKLYNETLLNNIHIGTITDSSQLGFYDNVNVDLLPLDYSILNDVEYIYPAGNNFFGYTTRGCVNKCEFCAVPILENKFLFTNNIKEQIEVSRRKYGNKKDLLLLDNNILGLPNKRLQLVVDDIISLGYIKTPNFLSPLPFEELVNLVQCLESDCKPSLEVIHQLWNLILSLKVKKMAKNNKIIFDAIIDDVTHNYDDIFEGILSNYESLYKLFDKYSYRKLKQRYVDFNQGLDAREIVKAPEKVAILSKLPLRPFRVAFDDILNKDTYIESIKIAQSNEVKYFSNYLLYNYEDKPIDLWDRLKININLAEELDIKIYSFPMKFSPINEIDRTFIGTNWTRYYLSALRSILNVCKGVVADGRSFFEKAFGSNHEEFMKILHMPKDFIVYRKHFEDNGLTRQWETLYNKMTSYERLEIVKYYFSKNKDDYIFNDLQKKALKFYYYRYDRSNY